MRDLASEGRFDYLLIESTGISEPLPVATTFDFRDEDGKSLSDVSNLDTMVTVVDAANLINNYSSTDYLKDHIPEALEYGIKSFVYSRRQPFDPAKIHAFFNQEWPGIIRAKGFFWVSTRPGFVGEVSQSGALVRHEGIGKWLAAVPKDQWPEDAEAMMQDWDRDLGDRRQEIVFIGLESEVDEAELEKRLDACLIADYIEKKDHYQNIADPFPEWFDESTQLEELAH